MNDVPAQSDADNQTESSRRFWTTVVAIAVIAVILGTLTVFVPALLALYFLLGT